MREAVEVNGEWRVMSERDPYILALLCDGEELARFVVTSDGLVTFCAPCVWADTHLTYVPSDRMKCSAECCASCQQPLKYQIAQLWLRDELDGNTLRQVAEVAFHRYRTIPRELRSIRLLEFAAYIAQHCEVR